MQGILLPTFAIFSSKGREGRGTQISVTVKML